MADADDLPYCAEYAKSGRASCKGCKTLISKDTLRLAVMVQSAHFDGKNPNWFHFDCFFGRNRVKNVGDIGHFEQLRWEDQEKIKKKIGGRMEEKLAEQSTSTGPLKDFSTDYAKSGRSTCRGCNDKIAKGIVRIARKDYESEGAKMYGPQDKWHHVDCFVKLREEYEYFASANRLCGFPGLTAEDQKMLLKKLPEVKAAGAVKRAANSKDEGPKVKKSKAEVEEEKLLKQQNQKLFNFRDSLQKEVSKKHMQYLFESNDQEVPSGESRLLDRLSDCLVFGALEPCPECKNGQLVYSREGYRCHGNLTEWTSCTYVTQKPKRKPFVVDDEVRECYSFLSSYKSKVVERFFPVGTKLQSSEQLESSNNLPLKGMKIVLCGKLKRAKADVKKDVEALGGKIVTKVDSSVVACISTEAEVKKMSKGIPEAKDADVHVVSESFLESLKNGDVIAAVTRSKISEWGGDLKQKIGDVVDGAKPSSSKLSKTEEMFKSGKGKIKLTLKGRAAVDPDSELEDVAHVLEIKDTIYSATLGLVDVTRGTNSYYRIQLLEADKDHKNFSRSYWLFRSWGRVGTTVGGKKTEKFSTKEEAIGAFRELYAEKTGNPWDNRDNFVKIPKKFYPIDIDYGQNDEKVKSMSDILANSKSKLHKAIQELVCMLFDVESMKKTMVEFEIDLEKMPLGKLSKKQIEKAYAILTELQGLIQKGGTENKFLDAANRFYTLIPHDFGLKKPTPLNNEDIIKQKIDMLDNLLEIEVAYNLLKSSDDADDNTKDPVDSYYEKLQTKIEVLDPAADEFKMIQKYVKNTHAATHNQYSLKVMEVYKISRSGEYNRYKPFKKLHNRQLLWHGSRITNYAGILSQGLRIAPPEAPVTGYMFGKGIYFADMVSKSANYCHTNKQNPEGLMLLSEVALGDMYELKNAEHITKLPKGKHSTKGLGRTQPNPDEKFMDANGVEVPLGKGCNLGPKDTSLLYNEYIVYDIAQANLKYLLKMKFNWKY